MFRRVLFPSPCWAPPPPPRPLCAFQDACGDTCTSTLPTLARGCVHRARASVCEQVPELKKKVLPLKLTVLCRRRADTHNRSAALTGDVSLYEIVYSMVHVCHMYGACISQHTWSMCGAMYAICMMHVRPMYVILHGAR